MYKLLLIFVIGYLTAATGFFLGAAITFILSARRLRLRGIGMSFAGGILISFICFKMFVNALNISGVYVGAVGMLAGVLLTVYIESIIPKTGLGVAIMMCAAIVFHSVPEGIALGSMLSASINTGVMFAAILALHCLPEGIAAAAYLRHGKLSQRKIMLSTFLLAFPMGVGSLAGAALSMVSPYFFSISLSFAGGVMLYITCGEIIPESNKSSGALATTIAAAVGFVLGALLIDKF